MSGQCCPAGEIHSGTPTGRVAKVHGLDCYIAEPPEGTSPKGVVVIIPDVFGWNLPNSGILADNYAAKGGFLVYLPEFMDGPAGTCGNGHATYIGLLVGLRGILKAKTEKGEGDNEVVRHESARHGFAARGSKTDTMKNERGMAAEA